MSATSARSGGLDQPTNGPTGPTIVHGVVEHGRLLSTETAAARLVPSPLGDPAGSYAQLVRPGALMRFAVYGLLFAALVFLVSGGHLVFPPVVLSAAVGWDVRSSQAPRTFLVSRDEEILMATSNCGAPSLAALPVRPVGIEGPGDDSENRRRADRVIVWEGPR